MCTWGESVCLHCRSLSECWWACEWPCNGWAVSRIGSGDESKRKSLARDKEEVELISLKENRLPLSDPPPLTLIIETCKAWRKFQPTFPSPTLKIQLSLPAPHEDAHKHQTILCLGWFTYKFLCCCYRATLSWLFLPSASYISSSHEYNRMFFRSCLLFVFLCPKPIYLVLIGGGEASLSDSWRLKQITAPNGPHNKELYCAEWWPLSKWALKLAEGGISLAHLYTVTPVQYVVFHGEHPEPNLTFHKVQQELFWAEV